VDQQHVTERARRTFVGGALVAVAGLLAALALVYTNASGVGAVAEQAQQQQRAESALGAASSARNALGQAILLAGTSPSTDLAGAAIGEGRAVLEAFKNRVTEVIVDRDDPGELRGSLATAVAVSERAYAAAASGDLTRAASIATVDAPPAFDAVVADLSAVRDELAASIAAAAAESGRVATASRFMVAFLVPTVAVVVSFIVARRRRKREQLSVALKQQRALNKSKDQLIANLSHELRTPLTGIYTSALTIEELGFDEPALAMELTDVIIDQSADLTRMVEDLLASAQADAGRLRFDVKPTPIAEVTATLEKEFDRFPDDITWSLEDAEVMADAGRLRQLLRNLVSNAAKYGDGVVEIAGRTVREFYAIEVVDNGPGVPPEVEERMFERFIHRGDQPLIVGSVGLGLSITKVLAEGMNGQVVYHRSGGRTAFEVMLQLASSVDMPPDPLPTESPSLVDEEPSVEPA
jgi:signal transduction histidine kinase